MTYNKTWALLAISLAMSACGSPTRDLIAKRQDGPCAAYTCGGAGSRKQQLTSEGATVQDLAITILETGCSMSSAYDYGDDKTGDSANFGLFKNNWGTIRAYCSQFQGQSADDYNNGAALNSDDAAAITCQHEQIAALGDYGFYDKQRNGATSNSAGATDYQNAINSNMDYLNQGHTTDDSLPCYNLHAI